MLATSQASQGGEYAISLTKTKQQNKKKITKKTTTCQIFAIQDCLTFSVSKLFFCYSFLETRYNYHDSGQALLS